jgi:hypothetical protein
MRRTGVRLLVAAFGAAAVLSATPAIAATCPNGNACFWTKPNLTGTYYAGNPNLYSRDTFYNIHTWYPNAVLGSFHNKWTSRIFISSERPGSINLCYPPTGSGSPDEALNYVYFGVEQSC